MNCFAPTDGLRPGASNAGGKVQLLLGAPSLKYHLTTDVLALGALDA